MKDNYEPWRVDPKEFYTITSKEDKLKFLLRFAILAPSSHNSQPWRFIIEGDQIVILPEETRSLPKSDKSGRQLFISLGAALENLLTAANHYGYRSELTYSPAGIPGAAALIRLEEIRNAKPGDEKIIKAILSRHTNRNKYSDKKLPDRFLSWVRSKSSGDFKIYIASDRKIKNEIANVVSGALIEAMDDRDFRSELSLYIKSNVTRAKTGMPMFGFGMPTILSFAAPYLLKRFNLNRLSKKEDEALLKQHTPYFVIISSVGDDKESWIKSGRIFESIALMAEKENIRIAPMAAAIEIGDNYKKLKYTLGTNLRPQVFFRMGYGEDIVPHSPRLNLEDVL